MIDLVQRLRCIKSPTCGEAADRIEQLERENAALEKRLQEIQRMCLGYQAEHTGLRKQLAEAEEELDRRPV